MSSLPPSLYTRARCAGVLAVYILLAAVCTWPLLKLSRSHVAGDLGDPVLNASILWWNATTTPFTERWWNPPYFHLTKGASAFTENLVGISPIATPLYWITRNPLAGYNLTLFLTWPFSAFTAYLLVRLLVRRTDAAFVAGLAYGFTPYRTAEMGHIQMVASFWIPLALLGLHGYLSQRRIAWLVLFGAAWLLQSLANGYLMFYGAVLIALWLVYFCSTRRSWRAMPAIVIAWVLWTVPLVPVMLKYREVHEYYGLRRELSEVVGYSVPARAWLEVTDFVWLWRQVLPDGKDDLFPGVTALTLVVLGIVAALRRRTPVHEQRSPGRRRFVISALAAATFVSLMVMVYTLFAGPWRVELGAVVIRVTDIDRAVSVALAGGLGLLMLTPSTRDALARRSPLMFYTAAIVAMAVLSCGPVIPVGSAVVFDYTPYYWLMYVPGFHALRAVTVLDAGGPLPRRCCGACLCPAACNAIRAERRGFSLRVGRSATGRLVARNAHGDRAYPQAQGGTTRLRAADS